VRRSRIETLPLVEGADADRLARLDRGGRAQTRLGGEVMPGLDDLPRILLGVERLEMRAVDECDGCRRRSDHVLAFADDDFGDRVESRRFGEAGAQCLQAPRAR